MRNMMALRLALALATAAATCAASATEILVNGEFETGNFSGWTATNNGVAQLTPCTVGGQVAGGSEPPAHLQGHMMPSMASMEVPASFTNFIKM